jgi:hypothetical protein
MHTTTPGTSLPACTLPPAALHGVQCVQCSALAACFSAPLAAPLLPQAPPLLGGGSGVEQICNKIDACGDDMTQAVRRHPDG